MTINMMNIMNGVCAHIFIPDESHYKSNWLKNKPI